MQQYLWSSYNIKTYEMNLLSVVVCFVGLPIIGIKSLSCITATVTISHYIYSKCLLPYIGSWFWIPASEPFHDEDHLSTTNCTCSIMLQYNCVYTYRDTGMMNKILLLLCLYTTCTRNWQCNTPAHETKEFIVC